MNSTRSASFEQLPRLLYLGDVPVESSYHGSALIYRLLQHYPPERLRVIEGNLRNSLPERRLAGVAYGSIRIGWRRPLYTRLSPWARLAYSHSVQWKAGAVARALGGFQPEAILTVSHDFLWLTAARYARNHSLPLHLICHDDWPNLASLPSMFRGWLDGKFGSVYRQAASRFCVSPSMAEEYERRYGAPGTVLYPSRSAECPVFGPVMARSLSEQDQLVIGYGGNSSTDLISGLLDLAGAIFGINVRLVIFGPFDEEVKKVLLKVNPDISFQGMVPYYDMINRLRSCADLLFVPMSFGVASRMNTVVSFPSKLADYTATGLPLLVYGPPYCSAVRWARMHRDVAEVVDAAGDGHLRAVVEKLRSDPARRKQLASRAQMVGAQTFNAESAQKHLHLALKVGMGVRQKAQG